MAEHILGMGTRKSVREIIALSEEVLAKKEGNPRRIVIRGKGIEVVADRREHSGPFESFRLSIQNRGEVVEKVQETSTQYEDACTITEEDGWQVISCPGTGQQVETKRLFAAVDTFTGIRRMPEVWRVRGDGYKTEPISPELLFLAMLKYKASDVHLSPGTHPVFRVDNEIRNSELVGAVSAIQIRNLIKDIAPDEAWEEFEREMQTSFNYHQVGLGYSRVSAFIKDSAPHLTFRFLPENIPSFEDLHIPGDTMKELAGMHHGLILVTGMTGSGKSTTVATMVDWINATKNLHILTIEHPVEYVHQNKKAVISQRNTGTDVLSFRDAVTGALRHDPDVIVIGEMRDPDTIRAAINAAATGHLVISTLHSNTASEVINRIISFFDPVERDLVKLQLRDCIRCIICQRLVPKVGGGRVPALEFMFNDIKPINDAIVLGDTDMMRIGIQQSVSHSFLFEDYLYKQYKKGVIDLEVARQYATEPSLLDQLVMGTYSIPRLDSIKGKGIDHFKHGA
jgi:twitching motility protein PilT